MCVTGQGNLVEKRVQVQGKIGTKKEEHGVGFRHWLVARMGLCVPGSDREFCLPRESVWKPPAHGLGVTVGPGCLGLMVVCLGKIGDQGPREGRPWSGGGVGSLLLSFQRSEAS
jgi:hypothetical protein